MMGFMLNAREKGALGNGPGPIGVALAVGSGWRAAAFSERRVRLRGNVIASHRVARTRAR
jgi:hypothetical protein